jgi:hypothetical protein
MKNIKNVGTVFTKQILSEFGDESQSVNIKHYYTIFMEVMYYEL